MREMLQSEARFRDIVSTAMDAIVIFDEEECIVLFNKAAEQMFRCDAAKAVGRRVGELFPPKRRADTVREIRRRAEQAQPGKEALLDWNSGEHVASFTGQRDSGEEF